MKIVLASSSPRRKEIMRSLGMQFEVIPSGCDESIAKTICPQQAAKILAIRKAEHVAKHITQGIVIGVDTLIDLDGGIIGKPLTESDAVSILKRLSGRWHVVRTAIAIISTMDGHAEVGTSATNVKMRQLSESEIASYVATGEPMDKAGAYAIQGKGKTLISSIDGPEDNVIGFPVELFVGLIARFGVAIR